MDTFIESRIVPEWDEIDLAREKTQHFLNARGFNSDVIDAVAMVTGELIENAIKYGTYDSTNQDLSYSVETGDTAIIIEVKNPISPEFDENLDKLDKMIQWIRGFQNPFEAYIERLKEVSIRSFTDGESGLGLTRIAYEGQSIVDFYATGDDIISVSAVYQL